MATPEPERLIAGRYQLRVVIGRGGMGAVWRAHDGLLSRDVAVKEIIWPPQMDPEERETARRRAVREAQLAARLRHPNVVSVYDIVEEDDRTCIVMELVPYRSLRDVVAEDGRLSPAHAARVGLGVLAALQAAHAAGVIHRDVKPANILLGPDDRVVLTDFGIAKAADSPALTISGMLIGSPSFLAPERARGESSDAAADLWALGASLYAAVEGRPPFDRVGVLASLTAVVTDEPDVPSQAGPLWPVISGLLRKDPATRLTAAEAEPLLHRIASQDQAHLAAAPARAAGEDLYGPVPELPVTARPGPADSDVTTPHEQAGSAEATSSLESVWVEDLMDAPAPADPEVTSTPVPSASPDAVPDASPAAVPDAAPAEVKAADPAAASLRSAEPVLAEPVLAEPVLAPPASAPPVGRRHRRSVAGFAVAAMAAVIAAVAAVVLIASPRSPGHPVALRPSPKPSSVSASTPATSAPPSSAAASPSPSSSVSPSAARGSSALPAGYYRFLNSTGFSIGVPRGWQISHVGHYVYIRDPANSGIFLLIDQSDQPQANALADWEQQATARQDSYPDYHLIRLQSVHYPQAEQAADWEFTYDRNGVPVQVLNRNVLANAHHAYALYWSTPTSDWNGYYHYFQAFAATFQPAS
jgi:eukaryotic-like serine/threonine-protein kinase